jgi:hypothetical protein
MNDDIIKMFDTNELNRLQRCAKNKDKKEIIKWGQDFERRIAELYRKRYKDYYLKEYAERLKDIDTALMYALHFGESTRFGNKRLKAVVDDLSETIKGFYNGEYNRKEYREMLIKDGIKIEKY